MRTTQHIGRMGEDVAANYLETNGFQLLERNWRCGRYELDIIALKDGILHFVEVKCRARGALTSPEDAATDRKFSSLVIAAQSYIEQVGWQGEQQFDLIAVEHESENIQLRYIPGALECRW